MESRSETKGEDVPVKRTHKKLKLFGKILVAALIFVVGVNVGNGRISLVGGNSTTQLPGRLNYGSVNQVYDALKANYDGKLTSDQLLDGMKKGLANATGDPYTEYFTAKEAKQFQDELNNAYSGIGAQLGKDEQGNLEIIAPVKGTPADKAGLQAKDIIVSIDGKSTEGMAVDEAVSKIRGTAGTKVTIKIIRNKSESLDFTITRDNFTVPSVESKVLDGNIGYMQINTFGDDTGTLAKQAAQKFKSQNVKAVVLDLRDNPGGEVDAAVDVASQWLPAQTRIMQEKRGSTVTHEYDSTGDATLQGIKTVVLVNAGSASASEIVAGALHDNKAATVVGEKSYGKGVVQNLQPLSGGAQLKVTVGSWYRPNGQNINHKGITPDQLVKLTPDDAKNGADPQLQAAQDFLSN